MSLTDWIRLEVGGKPFHTTLSTLLSCPGSLLANMFDPESGFKPAYSENGVYYLDSNPKYFGIILDWLRYQKVIADSDTNLSNVAAVADYFGIVELVEKLKPVEEMKPVGKWVKFKDLFQQNQVSAMKMTLSKSQDNEATAETFVQIAQFPNGLKVVKEDKIKAWGGKVLKLDLKGREPVWVPTVLGQLPPGAIAVKGRGGEKMYIGRRFFNPNGSLQKKVEIWSEGDSIEVPNEMVDEFTIGIPTMISAGYVNEKGVFGITHSSVVDHIINAEELCDQKLEIFSNTEFEVLCAF